MPGGCCALDPHGCNDKALETAGAGRAGGAQPGLPSEKLPSALGLHSYSAAEAPLDEKTVILRETEAAPGMMTKL